MTFACKDKDRDKFGRKYYDTGPGVALETLPNEHFVVVDHGVLDFVLENGVPYFFWAFLVFKFGTVASNKNYRVFPAKLLLQIFQVRKNMQAVDATVSPKIYERDFAFQVFF